MSTEKMREEFENSPRFKGMDFTRAPGHPDYYESPYSNGAWDGWQASRAALVINLPQRWSYREPDGWREDREGSSLDFNETVEVIEALGVKVRS
jgi:hypothetical protein